MFSLTSSSTHMDPSNPSLQVMAGNSLESQEKKVARPQEQALKCPRCDSTNTKFCYYNNYSLSQPRYFCKGCKRYWTQGGTLRNVPVGGGCRKNTKRSSSSSAKRNQEQEQLVPFHHISSSTNSNHIIPTLPLLTYDPNDLTLAFASLHNQNHQNQLPLGYNNSLYGNLHFHSNSNPNPNTNTISSTNPTPTPTTTFLDALKSGFLDTQGGISQNMYNGYGNEELGEVLSGAEEIFLPYEDMSGSTTTTTATIVTTTRQELCRGRDGDQINNRGFWNFPWQQQVGSGEESLVGSGGGGDAGREYWNGLGQSWHGLVNSPLM